MSLTLQTIFSNKNPTSCRAPLCSTHSLNPRNLLFLTPNLRTHFTCHRLSTSRPRLFSVGKINASLGESYGASGSQANGSSSALYKFNFDGFLSVLEFLCLASSVAVSVYVALRNGAPKGGLLGSKILVWQCVVLVSGVVVGAVIRRRQWRRICGRGFSRGSASYGVDFLGRVEKMEEDLRSSATIIRVLSRQLEKLGIRVRVSRKTLKEPIAETAALAQKNSEVTRALAAREDVLEKEMGEIQKVLLAMQEQQQKQLELILAIGKAGKLWESERIPTKDESASSEASKSSVDEAPQLDINQVESLELQKQANIDRT